MPSAPATRPKKAVKTRKRGTRAAASPLGRHKLQLKLQSGLKATERKAIVDKAAVMTAGVVRHLFGDSGDAELATYYIIDVPRASKIKKAVDALRGTAGVEVVSTPAPRRIKSG